CPPCWPRCIRRAASPCRGPACARTAGRGPGVLAAARRRWPGAGRRGVLARAGATAHPGAMITTSIDAGEERYLRRAVELARLAREAGDRPYGAVLVDRDGRVLAEGRNATVSDGDPTSHAGLNAVRAARVAPPGLTGATMYASGEPCAMCSAAMIWAGVPRVVFGASIPAIRAIDPS